MRKLGLFLIVLLAAATPVSAASEVFPGSGPIGTTVTISGEGFGKFMSVRENAVLFGSAPGLIEHWENGKIAVRVPLKAVSGPVSVKQGKKVRKIGAFTVEVPVVKEVTPTTAMAGQIVQILGRNFGPTRGQKDSEMQFGVNDVLMNGIPADVVRWKDSRIEVRVPSNASSGNLLVRLASVDPLPDGSCCAPVQYVNSNAIGFTVIASILIEPTEGPMGTPVVISGSGFGERTPGEDAVLFNGVQAPILEWANTRIRVAFPLNGTSGPVTLKKGVERRAVGDFRLTPHRIVGFIPDSAPIGTLVTISGENFGVFFDSGPNQVLFGGVLGRVFQWSDRAIDVWVPVSAKSGPVVVRRGAGKAKPDGTCCDESGFAVATGPDFTLTVPKVESIMPPTAEVGSVITIKGSGFGEFLKTDERTQDQVSRLGHLHQYQKFDENISRTAVLFPANQELVKSSHVAGYVESWSDSEIKVHIPQVAIPGEVVISRGSWDLLPDGTCCKDKQWVLTEAGFFKPTGQDKIDADYRKNLPKSGGESSF